MRDARTLDAAFEAVRAAAVEPPAVGLVLGSGLGALAGRIEAGRAVAYADVPGFPRATAPGHVGRFVFGRLEGVPVVAMQGRFHLYEGYTPAEVTLPIRLMDRLGCRALIVTNAAGGLDPAHRVGDLMLLSDHLFLPGMVGFSPLRGLPITAAGPIPFVDMNNAYDADLRALARRVAAERNLTLHEGVYAMVVGPHFEAPAEIRALRALGADAVGMSTCPEVVVARHCGMRVLGISCITNLAAGIQSSVSHTDVLLAGREAAPRFEALVRAILGNMEPTS